MLKIRNALYSEWLKICYAKSSRIILGLVLFLQTGFAYLAAKQFLEMGLDATPMSHPQLLEAVPALQYIGFESLLFGILPLVVWGVSIGVSEFRCHSLRTSLLSVQNRALLFLGKALVLALASFLIALLGAIFSIMISHFALGAEGLNPWILTPWIWRHIGLASLACMAMTMLGFGMGFFFQSVVLPLLFLIPQIYNVGSYLAERVDWARYLPFSMANGLIASSEKTLSTIPQENILLLGLWVLGFGALAYFRLAKKDLGGSL